MTSQEFQRQAENVGDVLVMAADRLRSMNNQTRGDEHEAKRYLALARNAAQESELWLGKAMVAFAGDAS